MIVLAEVFEGGAEVIDGVVQDDKAVVEAVGNADLHGGILPVVPLYVHRQCLRNAQGDDGCADALVPFGDNLLAPCSPIF